MVLPAVGIGSIHGMKVSLSIPSVDIEFLDSYANEHGIESRSATVQRAISLLRASELGDAYEVAWAEWEAIRRS